MDKTIISLIVCICIIRSLPDTQAGAVVIPANNIRHMPGESPENVHWKLVDPQRNLWRSPDGQLWQAIRPGQLPPIKETRPSPAPPDALLLHWTRNAYNTKKSVLSIRNLIKPTIEKSTTTKRRAIRNPAESERTRCLDWSLQPVCRLIEYNCIAGNGKKQSWVPGHTASGIS